MPTVGEWTIVASKSAAMTGFLGKSLAVGKIFAIVDDRDLETGEARHFAQAQCDVPAAEDVQPGGWNHRLDKNFQRPAANQSGIVAGIVVQIERQGTGFFFVHHLAGGLPEFSFDASASDCAQCRTIVTHQRFGGAERRQSSRGHW